MLPALMKLRNLKPLMTAALMVAVPTLALSETPNAKSPAAAATAVAQPEIKMPETPKDVAAAPADTVKTKTGLASKVLQAGTGDKKPTAADTVTVHYSGWTTDGKMFDSSVTRGEPASFPLGQVIAGWTEGLQLMVVGEKRRFWIPEELAYGPVVEGSGRPGGMLCFDVELIGIKEAPKPPADTQKTPEGLLTKSLKKVQARSPQRIRSLPSNLSPRPWMVKPFKIAAKSQFLQRCHSINFRKNSVNFSWR